MPTKQQKADAEPFLEVAARDLRDAKVSHFSPGMRAAFREHAARQITKANQLLKGKTNV